MRRLSANAVGCVLLLLALTAHAGDIKPMRFGPRNQNADGNVVVSYDRAGKEKFGPGITLTIKGAEREGVPMLHIREALYFVDAKLDNTAKQMAVVFVDGVSVVYRRYHVNAGRWESDVGGALMEYDLKLQKSNRMELTDMNTLRWSFPKKGETFRTGGRVHGEEMPNDEVSIATVDEEGNVFLDGKKISALNRKEMTSASEQVPLPVAGTSTTASRGQQEREERAKKVIASLGRGRSGGNEQEIGNAIAILEEGSSTRDDDLALIALYGMQKNLTGMRGTEWTPAVVSNYCACVSHLKNVRLDAETKANWPRYSELKDMACELNGGEQMLALVIRTQLLVELKQYVDRARKSDEGDVQEIQVFIKKEAKAILREWPESELRKMIEKFAADQQ